MHEAFWKKKSGSNERKVGETKRERMEGNRWEKGEAKEKAKMHTVVKSNITNAIINRNI